MVQNNLIRKVQIILQTSGSYIQAIIVCLEVNKTYRIMSLVGYYLIRVKISQPIHPTHVYNAILVDITTKNKARPGKHPII